MAHLFVIFCTINTSVSIDLVKNQYQISNVIIFITIYSWLSAL